MTKEEANDKVTETIQRSKKYKTKFNLQNKKKGVTKNTILAL
jgi:hypothetical protein